MEALLKQKKVAIIQSNYIPWRGYFDIINLADECILLDDVQYTRRDWRNRNLIKTASGLRWLTIPVNVKGNYKIDIRNVEVATKDWNVKHWSTIVNCYSKAGFFAEYKEFFETLYLNCLESRLSNINYRFIQQINKLLGINTPIKWSWDYSVSDKDKTNRLISICKKAGATTYISGPSAKNYIDESLFQKNGLSIYWMNYDNYPEYRQLFPPFRKEVTIIDLIFNEGRNAKLFLKSSIEIQ